MKLVLCSEGFRTPNTVQACVDLVGKPQGDISIAIINEGYAVEEGDKRWVLDNLQDVAQNFTGGIDIVNLLALPLKKVEKNILKHDAIFALGGDPDYVMHVFNRTGFSTLLPKLLEKVVYVGSSASSMVMGKRLSDTARSVIYGQGRTYGTRKYFEFIDAAIIPHIDSPYFATCQGILPEAAKLHTGTIYGLNGDSAIVVNGQEQTVIGSAPVIIE